MRKTKNRKIIAPLIFTIVILLICFVGAMGANELLKAFRRNFDNNWMIEGETNVTKVSMDLGEFKTRIIEISIISSVGNGFPNGISMGHSFVRVKNNSDEEQVSIFGYSIVPGEIITLGTFGFEGAFSGIWMNLEAYKAKVFGYYEDRVSLSEQFIFENMAGYNEFIYKIESYLQANNNWKITDNCSSFAKGLWNSLSGVQLTCVNNPNGLSAAIKLQNYATLINLPVIEKVMVLSGTQFCAVEYGLSF